MPDRTSVGVGDERRYTMKLTKRDLIATVIVAAIGVPYIGYLVNGEMPFVKDPRGMSAVGLLLGALAFVVIRDADEVDRTGKLLKVDSLVSLTTGIGALLFAETVAGEALLAVFMGSILLTWAYELTDRAGLLRTRATTAD
jgi:NhaP-type Na+/H+ or K+/H+ antiporter